MYTIENIEGGVCAASGYYADGIHIGLKKEGAKDLAEDKGNPRGSGLYMHINVENVDDFHAGVLMLSALACKKPQAA